MNSKIAGKVKMFAIFFLLLSFITHEMAAQSTERFTIVFTNAFGNIIRTDNNNDDIVNYGGRYSFGTEFRYRLGKGDNLFRYQLGLSYAAVGQKAHFVFPQPFEVSEIFSKEYIHYIGIPFNLIVQPDPWYGGVTIDLHVPFRTTNKEQVFYTNGNPSDWFTGKSNVNFFLNFGFGLGILTGRTVKLTENLTLVVEGVARIFNVITPLWDDESTIVGNDHPYWIGVNVGLGF